jgi:hypothetical protein
MIIKLGLSGGSLVVKVGGGSMDFLEYLERKGVLVSNQIGGNYYSQLESQANLRYQSA